jgi:hypothetical protein
MAEMDDGAEADADVDACAVDFWPEDGPLPLHLLPVLRSYCVDGATGAIDIEPMAHMAFLFVRSYAPDLHLSFLGWSIGDDYDAALIAAAKELGVPVEERTKRDSGTGVAKLLSGKDRDIIVTSTGMIGGLFEEDLHWRNLALNTLHHEMCHAHDAALLRKNPPRPRTPSAWSQPLHALSKCVWKEYSADRRAFPTLAIGECIHAPLLATEVVDVERRVKSVVATHRDRGNNDPGQLFADVLPDINWLLQLFGYVLGTAAGSGGSLEARNPDTAAALEGSCLHEWREAAAHLDALYRTVGTWPSFDVFAPLEDFVRRVYLRLGMRMTQTILGAPYLQVT